MEHILDVVHGWFIGYTFVIRIPPEYRERMKITGNSKFLAKQDDTGRLIYEPM